MEKSNKLLKASPNVKGYLTVSLKIGGKRHIKTVHRLVAEAFIGAVPEGYHVRHIDGNKYNNHVSNLEFATPQEIKHAELGITITDKDVEDIRQAYAAGDTSYYKLAKQYNVSHGTIFRIVKKQGAYKNP